MGKHFPGVRGQVGQEPEFQSGQRDGLAVPGKMIGRKIDEQTPSHDVSLRLRRGRAPKQSPDPRPISRGLKGLVT